MNMKTAFAVFSLIGGLVACGGDTEETTTGTTSETTTETGTTYTTYTTPTTTTGTTSTTSTTTTTEPTPAAYTMYEGWETMDFDQSDFGFAAYSMRWDISGTPLSIDSSCTNCEFMFAVTGTVDAKASTETYDYFNADYGYSSDFDGNGETWVMNYYGSYYWWGYASLTEMGGGDGAGCTDTTTTTGTSSTTTCTTPTSTTTTTTEPATAYRFNYWYGYEDYAYTYGGVNGYLTYYQFGNVTVQ
jgi:hypothetical protein